MINTRRAITFKVLIGYLLLAGAIALAYWFVYPEIKKFINPQEEEQFTNKKLAYISNALTYLYEAETVSRTAMATGSMEQYNQYKILVDSINIQIDSVKTMTQTTGQSSQLDSIKVLLTRKSENMLSMVDLRKEQLSRSFYDEAIAELIKDEIYFEDYENDPRLNEVDSDTKEKYVEIFNFLRRDNIKQDEYAKSMAENVRNVLARIERRKKSLEAELLNQENELLSNDRNINNRIRNLLSTLERESVAAAEEKELLLNAQIDRVSETLKIIGITSVVLTLIIVFLIFKDTSRNQKYSRQLEESNAYTQSLLKSREQLMATITHDMRSPLNTIIGFTDLLDKTSLSTTQENYLNHVQKSSDYMLRLVNDLLDFSKLEAGRITIEQIAFNAKNLVEDVMAVAIPTEQKENVTINTHIAKEVDRFFISDPFRIKQILSNLISNAYKFTEAGYIAIKASYIDTEKPVLKFEIEDSGIGIPAKKQHLIFQEFSQADEQIERKYGGFGLGLAITKKLVDLLDGNLQLKSTENKGSTFIVTLPVTFAKNLPQEKSPSVQKIDSTKYNKVLLVDDEPAQIALTGEILSKLAITYDYCSNGIEAWGMLHQHQYDLVLTDIQMPQMTGIELVQKIRSESSLKNLPVIALSGNTHMHKSDYTDMGFTTSLKKPFKPQELITHLTTSPLVERQIPINERKVKHTTETYSLEELSIFADNDKNSLNAILDIFITSTLENKQLLELSLKARGTQKVNRIAHKMLPMMRQLNVYSLIPILQDLEHSDLNKFSEEDLYSLQKELDLKLTNLLDEITAEVNA